MELRILDHVALWVGERDRIADFVTTHLGMHVIERTDAFTLVGADARRSKLTLFAAEPPRRRGALKHVAFRVSDLETAAAGLPDDWPAERRDGGLFFDLADGLRLGLVERETEADYDFDHVALFSANPDETARAYEAYGFQAAQPRDGVPRVELAGAFLEFWHGDPDGGEQPLLNHVAVLVESADASIATARERGIEVADIVDAPNTYAAFLRGPDGVRIEYVEHKPTFALK
ncbi:MAG: VOC family protein [Actinomycetota bacterium]|nr:VOC family protein [Actinomycetota bacterium]